MKISKHLFFAVTCAVLSTGVNAQDTGHIDIKTVVQKEAVSIDDTGERTTELVTAETVVPGDEVVYTVSFSNVSDAPAENVVITNPLPEQLTYVGGSAFGPGADVQFSVDGGESFAAADELSVTEDGFDRPARNEDFTHIRWVMNSDIAPGEHGMAQFRARLN